MTFGLFFGIAVVGLILIDAPQSTYLDLVKLHFYGGVITFLILLGALFFPFMIYMVDFLLKYIIPAASLLLVVYPLIKPKITGYYED